MNHNAKSIRTFIGATNFKIARQFYNDLGFEESILSPNMSYFRIWDSLGFYLQDYNVKDWIDNTMIFLEVDDVDRYYKELQGLGLPEKYENVRLTTIQENDWGANVFCTIHPVYCGTLVHSIKSFLQRF